MKNSLKSTANQKGHIYKVYKFKRKTKEKSTGKSRRQSIYRAAYKKIEHVTKLLSTKSRVLSLQKVD